MNCIEAQVMLAAHRELKNVDEDTTELDEHLEHCPACRQILASHSFIGEKVRELSALEPRPEMHDRLLRALAAEHFHLIRHSPASTPPPPDFLKPYMQEHAHSSHDTDALAAFSTARTGPLPVLATPLKKRSGRRMSSHFAIIGLAAVFFMALMMSGITTLLFLAKNHAGGGTVAISGPLQVQQETYATFTPYQHVVSAVGDAGSIYYSAYGNDTNSGWMLERLDRSTKISTPLLTTPSITPLVVLGSENGWLVWLQFDSPNGRQGAVLHGRQHTLLRDWSLHYLSLVAPHSQTMTPFPTTRNLVSGTFDQATVASWVHMPVQGVWFIQDTLLVAFIGNNGAAHLMRYPLATTGTASSTELGQAAPGHILTSPTATSDGTQIYWADEWDTADGILHSNIWTRQELDASISRHGRFTQEPIIITEPFLQNGTSFRPTVVNNELFLLDSSDRLGSAAAPASSPTAAQPLTPSPTATPNSSASTTSWADNSVYAPPLDMGVRGNLVLLPLKGDPTISPTLIDGAASGLQAGRDFVLWQSADANFNMFDASTRAPVNLNNDAMAGAQFVAVNGITAVWASDNGNNPQVTLQAFNWPRK